MHARPLRILSLFGLLSVPFTAFPQGDDCATALPITPGTYFADGPASGVGFDGACWGAGSATMADWYVYTPAASGTVDVYSCLGGADTRVSVFTGSCGFMACVGSNDDFWPISVGGFAFASQVNGVPVFAGTPVYVQWDNFWT